MILKLKQTPGIYLVGFMGCGKSRVGSALADELGWSFYDLDLEIEKAAGVSVSEVFDHRGEAAFRALETEALKKRVYNVRTGIPQVIIQVADGILNGLDFRVTILPAPNFFANTKP